MNRWTDGGVQFWLLKGYPKIYFTRFYARYFSKENNASLIFQVKMASSLCMAGGKNQLIMKYCSKFLVSSFSQNIVITYIKKFTIVNILG